MAVILIVDDVLENIRLLKRVLERDGQIIFARDGASALALAAQHRPDLILLDLMMPGIDGHETCRRLKADASLRDIPVLFVTGAGGEGDEATGLALGAIDYITKPYCPEIVRARVRNHLALVAARNELREANAALTLLATTDVLSGVCNRRRLIEVGEQEVARTRRGGLPLAALMLDIDHFKRINDGHGHASGDRVIQAVARLASACVREIDSVGRFGGEEFVLVLPGTTLTGAAEVGERLRAMVAGATVEGEHGQALGCTVSIGAAQFDAGMAGFDALVSVADQALYRAKHAGRNRVECGPA